MKMNDGKKRSTNEDEFESCDEYQTVIIDFNLSFKLHRFKDESKLNLLKWKSMKRIKVHSANQQFYGEWLNGSIQFRVLNNNTAHQLLMVEAKHDDQHHDSKIASTKDTIYFANGLSKHNIP